MSKNNFVNQVLLLLLLHFSIHLKFEAKVYMKTGKRTSQIRRHDCTDKGVLVKRESCAGKWSITNQVSCINIIGTLLLISRKCKLQISLTYFKFRLFTTFICSYWRSSSSWKQTEIIYLLWAWKLTVVN